MIGNSSFADQPFFDALLLFAPGNVPTQVVPSFPLRSPSLRFVFTVDNHGVRASSERVSASRRIFFLRYGTCLSLLQYYTAFTPAGAS